MTVELRTLGSLQLKDRGGRTLLPPLSQPKRIALLVYLALARPRAFHRRDKLLPLFWPELDEQHARANLRKQLHHLRQALGNNTVRDPSKEEVGLDPDSFWCDVWAFRDALARQDLAGALELYRGDLLEGFFVSETPEFERWLEEERSQLREQALLAAWALAEAAQARRDAVEAVHWARQAMLLSPHDEGGVRCAIALFDRVGHRSEALQAYETFARWLKQEFDAQPAPETRELIEAVRARADAYERVVEPPSPSSGVSEALVTGVAPHPTPVRRSLSFAQRPGAAVGIVALATLLVTIGALIVAGKRAPEPAIDPTRVLVDIFENRSGDPALDPLGPMATDRITAGLTYTGFVDVISLGAPLLSRSPTEPDRNAAESATRLRALAEANGTGTVVWGSFYRRGDSVRFEAQVAHGRSGEVLATVEPVRGPLDAPEEAVELLRDRVMAALATLTDPRLAKWARFASKPPTFEAYEQFVEGIELHTTQRKYQAAIARFLRAAALDSSFTMPLLWATLAHMNLGQFAAADSLAQALNSRRGRLAALDGHFLDYHLADIAGNKTAALQAMRRLVEIAPGSDYLKLAGSAALALNRPREAVEFLTQADPESGWLRGWYQYWGSLTDAYHRLGDHQRELEAARRGRRQYPDNSYTLWYEMRVLAALGREEKVNARLDEHLQLSTWGPYYPGYVMLTLGAELRAHGHHAASSNMLHRAADWLESRPAEEGTSRRYLAMVLFALGEWEESKVVMEQLLAEDPNYHAMLENLALLANCQGDREETSRLSRLLEARGFPFTWRRPYFHARIAAGRGERERAMVLLREAIASGFPNIERLHATISLESLWDYPPFRELLRPNG